MAFTLQIIASFPSESFISADTFLPNPSVSVGQGFPAGGLLSRGEAGSSSTRRHLPVCSHQGLVVPCPAPALRASPAPYPQHTSAQCLQGYAEGPWLWFCPAPVLCICSSPALQPRDAGLRPISLLPGRPGESCFADSSSPQELLLWLPRRDPKAANYSASLPVPFNPRNTSKN